MSNLVKHAENEMKLAGLYDKDADYAGMIPEAVMALVKAHSEQEHSGGSHWLTLQIFNKVINFKTLIPIGSTQDEWFKHDYQTAGKDCWQNTRQSSVFSQDGGKTWYDIDCGEEMSDKSKIFHEGDCNEECSHEPIQRIRKALEKAKAMIKSASSDWPSLIQTLEKIETGSGPAEKK